LQKNLKKIIDSRIVREFCRPYVFKAVRCSQLRCILHAITGWKYSET